jgi:lysophospholipase L1-like esterase
MRRVRDAVINTGVSGETSAGLLADFDWRVRRFRPDVVSVMIGMNDAARPPEFRAGFADRLRDLLRRIRAAGAIPILHRTNPVDEESRDASVTSRAPSLPEINAVIARIAAEEQVIVVDHWTHWQDARRTDPLNRTWLADPIHPNPTGHRQMAILLFRTLGIYDETTPACRP